MKKKKYEMAVNKSISMPEILFDDAIKRMRDLQLSQFSDYMQALVRADVRRKILKLA